MKWTATDTRMNRDWGREPIKTSWTFWTLTINVAAAAAATDSLHRQRCSAILHKDWPHCSRFVYETRIENNGINHSSEMVVYVIIALFVIWLRRIRSNMIELLSNQTRLYLLRLDFYHRLPDNCSHRVSDDLIFADNCRSDGKFTNNNSAVNLA